MVVLPPVVLAPIVLPAVVETVTVDDNVFPVVLPRSLAEALGLTLPGGMVLSASVTNEGVEALDLKVGAAATAVFKAYAVMVAAQA